MEARYQVYKKLRGSRMMHISSLLASSRVEAMKIVNREKKENRDCGEYYVSGLCQNIGEDITGNFPPHVRRRIENGGRKVKFKGTLYKLKNTKNEKGKTHN